MQQVSHLLNSAATSAQKAYEWSIPHATTLAATTLKVTRVVIMILTTIVSELFQAAKNYFHPQPKGNVLLLTYLPIKHPAQPTTPLSSKMSKEVPAPGRPWFASPREFRTLPLSKLR